jgi:resuscitation-promoting factor RpfA
MPLDPAVTPARRRRAPAALAVAALSAAALLTACTRPGDPTDAQWAALRACESGGNYAIDTGNGFFGAYQFALGTWQALGFLGTPAEAAPATQDAAALQLWHQSGWSPWPTCGAVAAGM